MRLLRALGTVLLALVCPVLLLLAGVAIGCADLCFVLFGRRTPSTVRRAANEHASIVIPNWNGRDLLEKFLPSVLAAARYPQHEVIVVDNASTDGSVDFLRAHFPTVRVLALERNEGFGGGSNAGFRAANHDVVVLLNNDMRVEPDFLAPLLAPFSDPLVFSVSCQIFFSDGAKLREETGLTETWWANGRIRVRHRIDPEVTEAFPCAYPGGGSSAFDRHKFLELGGFDPLYHPFYYEDTDLGAGAWKRGWKLYYEPRSIVFHEHRGTIGRKFSRPYIEAIVKRNLVLYTWKNIHRGRWFWSHIAECAVASFFAPLARSDQARAMASGVGRAALRTPQAIAARWRARQSAVLDDVEAYRRQRGGYFRDRFLAATESIPERLNLLFVSPYPIEPPTHGGAVFMKQTLTALRKHIHVHVLGFLDNAAQVPQQEPLRTLCASARFLVRKHNVSRNPADIQPRVVREFEDPEFSWLLHRTLYLGRIDAVQIEYTFMAQYFADYTRIPQFLFEHDISFQSMGRRISAGDFRPGALLAYMQLLRFELKAVRQAARVQVCSPENGRYLLNYVPGLAARIDAHTRAVIDPVRYPFVTEGREANTILFAGSFNHQPNVQGLLWFMQHAFDDVLRRLPAAKLVVAGSGQSSILNKALAHPSVTLLGYVPDMQVLFARQAVLICPVLSGSGVRVKLLEAFASGIPVVSTSLGAEGLIDEREPRCLLSDEPKQFAAAVVTLLEDPQTARSIAYAARRYVEYERNAVSRSAELAESYRNAVAAVRPL